MRHAFKLDCGTAKTDDWLAKIFRHNLEMKVLFRAELISFNHERLRERTNVTEGASGICLRQIVRVGTNLDRLAGGCTTS